MSDRLLNLGVALLDPSRHKVKYTLEMGIRALERVITRAREVIEELNSEGEGHTPCAEKAVEDQPTLSLPQNRAREGRASVADRAKVGVPICARSSIGEEDGRSTCAAQAQVPLPISSPTLNRVREGRVQRADKAIVEQPTRTRLRDSDVAAAARLARSVLDTFTMPDGRALRAIRFRELPGYFTSGRVAAAVAKALYKIHGNSDPARYIGDVASAQYVESVITAAKKEAADDWAQ